MFNKGECVFVVDEKNKKYWFNIDNGFINVPELGIVNGDKLINMESGNFFNISNKLFTIFKPKYIDIISNLERRTQIITPKDSSDIILNCDIKNGNNILEVGLGSGALTLLLTRLIQPDGKVYSIDLIEKHLLEVEKNLKKFKQEKYWCGLNGDARTEKINIIFDSIITDVPDPWLVLENLYNNLKSGGTFCSYVPNTNQVEKIVNLLNDKNFFEIITFENIQRKIIVHNQGVRPSFENLGHTGYLIFGRKRTIHKQKEQ